MVGGERRVAVELTEQLADLVARNSEWFRGKFEDLFSKNQFIEFCVAASRIGKLVCAQPLPLASKRSEPNQVWVRSIEQYERYQVWRRAKQQYAVSLGKLQTKFLAEALNEAGVDRDFVRRNGGQLHVPSDVIAERIKGSL